VSLAAVVLFAPGSLRADDDEDDHTDPRVCGESVAYTYKLGRKRAREREAEALEEARTNLTRRLWSGTFGSGPEGEVDRAFPSLRVRYGLDELLAEGEEEWIGTRKEKTVLYCVTRETYGEAQRAIRARRRSAVAAIEERFRAVEIMLERGETGSASTVLPQLELDLLDEALETESYESVFDGRTRPFYVWLLEWEYAVSPGEDFVEYLTDRAEEMLDTGHLDEADRFLNEAIAADRDNERALRLRSYVQARRARLVTLLREARDLAERAWFDEAEQKLDEAREVSADDATLIDETARDIANERAEYLALNPLRQILVYGAFGSLGVDTGAVESRVEDEVGIELSGSFELSIGGGANFRVGRNLMVGVTGSWGLVEDERFSVGGAPLEIYDFFQLTGSAGFRTRRSERSQLAYHMSGGLAFEAVDVNSLLSEGADTEDSRTALFARFGVEWKRVLVFVQHGIGFSGSPDSLVGWSNRFQFGVATVF
jgi:hypothetical protein